MVATIFTFWPKLGLEKKNETNVTKIFKSFQSRTEILNLCVWVTEGVDTNFY